MSATEAARILGEFRNSGVPGQYYLEFELRALPRRGEERVYQGRLWGMRNAQGPISRVELTDAGGAKHRLLVQNGERAAVWRWANGRATGLGVTELFAPVIPGVELTAFDLQMPFLYWPDAKLQGVDKVRGRPAHTFLFRAPPEFAAQHPEVAAARASLDTQMNALVQTELLDRNGKVLKRFSPLSLKVVDKQVLPKTIDFRNEATGDKARMQTTAAALGLELPPAMFAPASLAEDARPPAADKVVRID
ncbi:MAG TPA: hypothetical protein VM029_02935 [Opitutaceae bacterium]|nr:hypothetical protein [Opitutaceae bacterium]